MSHQFTFLRVAFLVACQGTLACSSDDPPAGEECNALANDGPDVTPELVTAGTPPTGGTIEDGQYEQTGFVYYPDSGVTLPPDFRTLSAVFEFTDGSLEAVVDQALGGDARTDRYSAAYAGEGSLLTLTYGCPIEGVVEQPAFTATPTEVRLVYRIANNTGTGELVLTKR
jgi:hypothetical protein